ncbi:MAG: VCBS repeat-containing protein [Planctomycetota bacterium]|nr:VCBS repeat-containing protein [Planctomycetota bacterium]MDA0919502.1 VCBS repeat-containing protein [Planctomycetota bacterium]MDA1159627.1 VCBS repeat-containing protein [Planctomycetota bacterium]
MHSLNELSAGAYFDMFKASFFLLMFVCLVSSPISELKSEVPAGKWRAVDIDEIKIGYGVQLTDVNGDGKPDIVLADQKTFQWYENPSWTKHIIAENLTERDNVCITARDIDGDGKCEIAVGGQWNYRESVKDGAVFYLIPPEDRTQLWTPVRLHNEPSTHRMHWVRGRENKYHLTVKPLRGRGSVDGDGAGLRVLEYFMPPNPKDEWKFGVVCDFIHLSHNFHPVNWDDDPEEELIIAGKEGVWHLDRQKDDWAATQLTKDFAGEIRDGKLPNGKRFIATVEPKHGSVCAVYSEPAKQGDLWPPVKVLVDKLKDGHALACADFLGVGSDQIVVGWRAMNDPGVPGIKLFTPIDKDATKWREDRLSSEEIAVEDIKVADLNGDGKVDIVAAARQTKNLVVFFNER